jgi:dipeptidyl aminopeptidase/acylaminoacyl peptidase
MTIFKTALLLLIAAWPTLAAQTRVMRPDDLFRVERVAPIAWSPDGARAAVEISRPGRWLGTSPPTGSISVVETASAALRRVSVDGATFVGFFGASWSPGGRSLAFFSVDTNAVVRPWIWHVGSKAPVMLRGLQMHDDIADSPTIAWSDDTHLVLLVRDTTRRNAGPVYVAIQRDRNAADEQRRALAGKVAAVTVIDSHDSVGTAARSRLVSVDVKTNAIATLAEGSLHHPALSGDRRTITYREETPGAMVRPSAFLKMGGGGDNVDAAYLALDWGSEARHIDSRTGASVEPPNGARAPARDSSVATLRLVSSSTEGTRLVLTRRGQSDTTIWRGNEWARAVKTGRAESIAYTSAGGKALTGWLLYPPTYSRTHKLPIVTIVYPGTTYSTRVPSSFDILNESFEHPQLFAAMGYGVLLASMPVSDAGRQASSFDELTSGVLPLVDTIIARGIADSMRIAVLGQSSGGYAVLGLVTQMNRFRSAIASAAYSDMASDYGTFYGEYRYGDGGSPQRAQILRMLQYERGVFGAPGPPWEHPEWYRANSPLSRVSRVQTPVMLIKGEADFVPLQDAEQFFTALYRQDKRVVLVRYAGEGHTITARANVLDLWQRLEAWLRETMPE